MKRQWRIRRQVTEYADGQQRWDKAYQHLLQWATTAEQASTLKSMTNSPTPQEVCDASGCLPASIDEPPSAEPDD
jgi:uncharacterized protein (UPF0548 family)